MPRKPTTQSPTPPTPSPTTTPTTQLALTGAAAELFDRVSARWTLDDVATQILRLACESIQRAGDCAAITAVEGLTIRDRWGAPKTHPMALLERDHRNAAANSLQKLGLNLE
jgi:hypothetical protein